MIPGLLSALLFRYDIMRHLKCRSVKDLTKFGDANDVKKALLDSIDTAPLNYFIVSIMAGFLGLYANFINPPNEPFLSGTRINEIAMPMVITFTVLTAALLDDIKKLLAYSEDFHKGEDTVM